MKLISLMKNKFLDSDIMSSISQSVHKMPVEIFSGYTLVHILEETNILINLFIKKSENVLSQNIALYKNTTHGPSTCQRAVLNKDSTYIVL